MYTWVVYKVEMREACARACVYVSMSSVCTQWN